MLRAATIGFLGIACLAWLPSPVAAEGERWFSAESDGGTFRLELQPSVTPLPVNELFELEVTVTLLRDLDDANPIWLGLDTQMPGHGHGMNTRARVEDLGNGKFVVRGLLLHMAGQWELAFDVAKGRVHEQAIVRVELK